MSPLLGFTGGIDPGQQFQTPDILNNWSFEGASGSWDSFHDYGGGTPHNTTTVPGYTLSLSQDVAYKGSWSAKVTWATNNVSGTPTESDDIKFEYDFVPSAAQNIYYRFYFYTLGTCPNDHRKWVRPFYGAGFDGTGGGLFLSTVWSPGGVSWCSAVNDDVDNDVGIGVPTNGVWHWIEVNYDRTGWASSPGARMRLWFDGNPVVGNNTGAPHYYAIGTSDGSSGFWGDVNGNPANGPWYYDGVADSAAHPTTSICFDNTFNLNNTNSGTIYYDWISVSSLGRIGP